jgi:hypothetical protein
MTRTQRDIIINVHTSSCRVPVIVRFQSNLNFLHVFSKNAQISDFMKMRPVGAELFHADGQTDTMKLTDAFRNFTNAPKSDTRHWLPVLPASQPKTAWPTKQNCRFWAEGVVRWQNFVNLSNTSQNNGEIAIYKTMRINLIGLHKTAVMRSHNTKQSLMQKYVIVVHVYLYFSKSLKCHIRYTDSSFEFNTGVDTQIQLPNLGRGSITLRNAVLCDKPTTLSTGTKEWPCITKKKKDVWMQGTPNITPQHQ